MGIYSTLMQAYIEKDQQYIEKSQEIKSKIRVLEEKRKKLDQKIIKLVDPNWFNEIIEPLAKTLGECYPDRTYEILGPFGLGSDTSIHFYKRGIERQDQFEGDNCISITFRPLGIYEFGVVDYSINTREYAERTIGEINGFNFKAEKIPDDATEEWFMQRIR